MPGGIFGKLQRRYGARLSGAERASRAQEKEQAFVSWLAAAAPALDCANAVPRGVAVVGGGFAGLAAAWMLGRAGVRTTLFEAREVFGGRVATDRRLIAGRIVEAGAELIGLNHPMWLHLAREFGLGLTALTGEDRYAGAGLEMPLRIKGKSVHEREKLYAQMAFVFRRISQDAGTIGDPFAPWKAPNAPALDGQSVADKVAEYIRLLPSSKRHPHLADAIELHLGNDNVLPTKAQSYLGLLALVAGGKFGKEDAHLDGYWNVTEEFRCSEGNDRLAVMLLEYGRFKFRPVSPVTRIEIGASVVKVTWLKFGDPTVEDFDYVILAAPPSAWHRIVITPPIPPGMEMTIGPAVKYLGHVSDRFWIKRGLAPSGMADDLGQTWEGTENQTLQAQGIDLSVFAGGVSVPKTDGLKHFRSRLPTLYPGFSPKGERYADWPKEPFIEGGYACPTVGQVTTIAKFLSTPHAKRLFFAGEHACMAFFGYMEGALQSGARAAKAVLSQCARPKEAPPRRERIPHEIPLEEAVPGVTGNELAAPQCTASALFNRFVFGHRSFQPMPDLTPLAFPGEPMPPVEPSVGDLLVRVARGEGCGVVAVVASPGVLRHDRLASHDLRGEGHPQAMPGGYVHVVERGAHPRTESDRFARRLFDAAGNVLPDTLLLRTPCSLFGHGGARSPTSSPPTPTASSPTL